MTNSCTQSLPFSTNGNQDILIIGAGGHAKVVIELFRAMGKEIAYCISNPEEKIDFCLGVPVLKGDHYLDALRAQGYSKIFIAIGSNLARQQIAMQIEQMGFELVNAISPHAIISSSVLLGKGIAIMAGAIINAASSIEDLSIINTGATVDHDCKIGKAVHIAPQCGLAGNVCIGDLSFLGVGCKVIPGIQVGKSSVIGAGSVLVKNFPDRAKAMGVPAKLVSLLSS